MKTRVMGIQNGNKENYGKDATLEGPCLETSATAGWVALNDSRGFEGQGPRKRVTVMREESAAFLAELKAFQQ